MINLSIPQLLQSKYICILCPTIEEYRSLFCYLENWMDLSWKSGRNVSMDNNDWNSYKDETAFFIGSRDSSRRSSLNPQLKKKYYLMYSSINDDDVPTSHVFTVYGFIKYIVQHGASTAIKFTLD